MFCWLSWHDRWFIVNWNSSLALNSPFKNKSKPKTSSFRIVRWDLRPSFVCHTLVATVWIFKSFRNSYVKILNLKVTELGNWVFRRWLGHGRKALRSGICAVIKGLRESPYLFHQVRLNWKTPSVRTHRICLAPWFWTTSRAEINKFLLIIMPSLWYFVVAAQMNQYTSCLILGNWDLTSWGFKFLTCKLRSRDAMHFVFHYIRKHSTVLRLTFAEALIISSFNPNHFSFNYKLQPKQVTSLYIILVISCCEFIHFYMHI